MCFCFVVLIALIALRLSRDLSRQSDEVVCLIGTDLYIFIGTVAPFRTGRFVVDLVKYEIKANDT